MVSALQTQAMPVQADAGGRLRVARGKVIAQRDLRAQTKSRTKIWGLALPYMCRPPACLPLYIMNASNLELEWTLQRR